MAIARSFRNKEGMEESTMNQNLKRILSLVLALMLALTTPIAAMANAVNEPIESMQFFENQLSASMGSRTAEPGRGLMTSSARSPGSIGILYDSFERDWMGNVIYPADYGGVYFYYSRILVVLIVGGDETRLRAVMSRATHRVQFREVEFSHNELMERLRKMNASSLFDSKENGVVLIHSWYLNPRINRIVVELAEYNCRTVALFAGTLLDSPMVVFVQSPGMFVAMSSPPQIAIDNAMPRSQQWASSGVQSTWHGH